MAHHYFAEELKSLEQELGKMKETPKKMYYLQKREAKEAAHESLEEIKVRETKEARVRLSRLINRLEKMLYVEEEELHRRHPIPEHLSTLPFALTKYKEVLHVKKDAKEDKKTSSAPSNKASSFVEPSQEVLVKQELRKIQPFCIEGDEKTLAILLNELQKFGRKVGDPYFESKETGGAK